MTTAATIPAIHVYVRRLVDDPLLPLSIRWKSAGAASFIWPVLSRSPKWVMALAYCSRSRRCSITTVAPVHISRTDFLRRFENLRRHLGNAILGKDERITLAV